jgi:hypothetical protein
MVSPPRLVGANAGRCEAVVELQDSHVYPGGMGQARAALHGAGAGSWSAQTFVHILTSLVHGRYTVQCSRQGWVRLGIIMSETSLALVVVDDQTMAARVGFSSGA